MQECSHTLEQKSAWHYICDYKTVKLGITTQILKPSFINGYIPFMPNNQFNI